jgi:hypothetical protein
MCFDDGTQPKTQRVQALAIVFAGQQSFGDMLVTRLPVCR